MAYPTAATLKDEEGTSALKHAILSAVSAVGCTNRCCDVYTGCKWPAEPNEITTGNEDTEVQTS